jgi:hypothetical protein
LCVAVYNGRAYFTDHRFRAFAWGGGGTWTRHECV